MKFEYTLFLLSLSQIASSSTKSGFDLKVETIKNLSSPFMAEFKAAKDNVQDPLDLKLKGTGYTHLENANLIVSTIRIIQALQLRLLEFDYNIINPIFSQLTEPEYIQKFSKKLGAKLGNVAMVELEGNMRNGLRDLINHMCEGTDSRCKKFQEASIRFSTIEPAPRLDSPFESPIPLYEHCDLRNYRWVALIDPKASTGVSIYNIKEGPQDYAVYVINKPLREKNKRPNQMNAIGKTLESYFRAREEDGKEFLSFLAKPKCQFHDDDKNHDYVILEHPIGTDLSTYYQGLHNNDKYTSEMISAQVQYHASQILRGIVELHKLGIVHGNISPRNIYVTAENTIKIGNYSDVQLLKGSELASGQLSDLKDFGKTIYELLYQKSPDTDAAKEIITRIKAGNQDHVLRLLFLLLKSARADITGEMLKKLAWFNSESGSNIRHPINWNETRPSTPPITRSLYQLEKREVWRR